MSDTQAAPAKARFLIHAARGEPLRDFLVLASGDPDIAVLDTIGPLDQPHTAVVEVSQEKARLLALHFNSTATANQQLTIEPDRPLSLFDTGPAGPF